MSGNIDSLCMGCMTFKADGEIVCSHCGFTEDVYNNNLAPHHLRPRTILNGKYLLGKMIGEGGFGITYLGWDLNLELKIAVKEYYPTGFVTRDTTSADTITAYAGDDTAFYEKGRDKFVEEARRLAKFYTLSGIVSVKDFFLANETAYIVMEYVDGVTLKHLLDRSGGRMPEAEVLEMMRPLMDSLSQIHKAGIIHRDISPDNIMLTKENNIKLLDFGAAREFAGGGDKSQTVLLKPGYAPEEQYLTHGEQGAWTDIYALCATMYRAIEGTPPPESPGRLRQDNFTGFSVPVDPRTQSVILKGLAVMPQDRWQSVPEMSEELYRGFSSGPVVARAFTQKTARLLKSVTTFLSRKKKPVAISVGAACLIFAAFLAGGQLRGGGADTTVVPESSVPEPEPSSSVTEAVPVAASQAPVDESIVVWNDSALEGMIRKAIRKPSGDIRKEDLEKITILNIRGNNISLEMVKAEDDVEVPRGDITSLEDLALFINLRLLEISSQRVTDVSPLAGLTELVGLSLYDNEISDISPLSGLVNLKKLDLGGNKVSDLSPLSGLDVLNAVGLSENPVADWSPVKNVKNVVGRDEEDEAVTSTVSSPPPSSDSSKTPSSSSSQASSSEYPAEEPSTFVEDKPFVFKTSKFTVNGTYTGDWKDGKPNGQGVMTMTQSDDRWGYGDTLASDYWEDGLIQGYGEWRSAIDGAYNGYFVNGLKHGKGKMWFSDGTVYDGQWKYGDFVG